MAQVMTGPHGTQLLITSFCRIALNNVGKTEKQIDMK